MSEGQKNNLRGTTWGETVLARVSRTFALCIRFLPPDVRVPVQVSYLLCRIADTIEDSTLLSVVEKRALLTGFAAQLLETAPDASAIERALPASEAAEVSLVGNTGRVLGLFAAQPVAVREVIAPWVREMCRGMAEYAPERIRTVGDDHRELSVLATEKDLDAYCYFVAGTVGHLLTGLFGSLRPELPRDDLARLDALAESFGAGLQLTNIIIDAADDQRRGVSYVPEDLCHSHGTAPGVLWHPGEHARARAVMGYLIRKARRHLADAVSYCEILPKAEPQIRLFCLVPVFLALRTLREVESVPAFPVVGQRVKIGRAAVYRTVAAARLCASSNHLVRAYAQHLEF
jgi:farnesyl-diphosphate farnesyltransferase